MLKRGRFRTSGFTLVEILIVVVILGTLAGIVVPQFASASASARQSAFVSSVRGFADAATMYQVETGLYLEDSSSGEVPAGFDAFIDPDDWTAGTPIGGVWDAEFNSFTITSALGVHFDGTGQTRDDAFMVEVDSIFDDGDLESGSFQRLAADRYYEIIAP